MERAQFRLGWLYWRGDHVKQDCAEAIRWFWKAADQGSAGAIYNIGIMSAAGQGTPADIVGAYACFDIAAREGSPDAAEKMKLIAQNLTEAEKRRAHILSSRWLAKHRPGG